MNPTDTRAKLETLFRRLTDPAVSDLEALADFIWFRKLALDAKDVGQALGASDTPSSATASAPSGPPVSMPTKLAKPAQPVLAGDGPVMPFGKWKGSALSRIAQTDAGYLRYMLTKELREPLLGQIKAALATTGHPLPATAQAAQTDALKEAALKEANERLNAGNPGADHDGPF